MGMKHSFPEDGMHVLAWFDVACHLES